MLVQRPYRRSVEKLDPRDRKTMLLAAVTGHLGPTVFRSTDGGRKWKEAERPPAFPKVENGDGPAVKRTFFLAPRQSMTYANTLFEAFRLSSGAGAVTIDATSAGSSAQLRVTSRTFTTGTVGTYGQSVPEVQPRQLEKTLYVTGIQSTAGYRTNIGLVNRGTAAADQSGIRERKAARAPVSSPSAVAVVGSR